MAKAKARDDTALLDALADTLRDGLEVVERFDKMRGNTAEGDKVRNQLARLDTGKPVTVASWELGAALSDIGSPDSKRVLSSMVDFWTVGRDGKYAPHAKRPGGRK
jgi:H2-forming N5,N10-methylenetetrahydromethanopterin dehydrogenase-like enzyme